MNTVKLLVKKARKKMPKFYHSDKDALIQYRARAVGFWRRFPLFWMPYFTGQELKIHISLVKGDIWYKQGTLRIKPPQLENLPFEGVELPVDLSAIHFRIPEKSDVEKKWQTTITASGPILRESKDMECFLELTGEDGSIMPSQRLAYIPLDRYGPFIRWAIAIVIAIIGALAWIPTLTCL